MDLADFKRFALKEAFYLRFNAMNEYASKTALIAGFGKYLTDLIQIEPTPPTQPHRTPYEKGPEAAIIFADAMNAVNDWKPVAEDERPTLANAAAAAAAENDKGKAPMKPKLPARKPTQDSIVPPTVATSVPPTVATSVPPTVATSVPPTVATPVSPLTPDEPSQPSGYTPDEVSSATGDLKTNVETEIDLDNIDLYDAPPPAYDGPPISSPLNSDAHLAQQTQYTGASFNSPYQSFANLPPRQQQMFSSPYPSHINLTDSPAPMHQQIHYQQPQHYQGQYHQDSSFYDPSNMMYSQINYHQLYRQVSQRQQGYAHRPYAEFQQQFNYDQHQEGQQQRQRVDAGGFRIPTTNTTSAEDEKEMLAQHYKQQEQQQQQQQQQYSHMSNYGNESLYSGSQYDGESQYGESQYGGFNPPPAPILSQAKAYPVPPTPPTPHAQPAPSPLAQQTQVPHTKNYEEKAQEEE
jgi:hypothetical protein